jgi:hypothetical protein
MLYLFTGSDVEKARKQAFAFVAAARAKEPNLAYTRLAREEITEAALTDAESAGGLFVSRLLIVLDDPFAKAKAGEEEEEAEAESESTGLVEAHLDSLVASDNAVVLLAPKLAATKAKKFSSKATKAYVFEKAIARDAARGFNTALVHALAARSREKLWLEVVRALRAGDAPEMLHGLLHWKARDLMEKGAPRWPKDDARTLSLALIALLQETRHKSLDLAASLERFALALS